MYFAYVLRSIKTGYHYYGHSGDIEERLKDHNNGRVKSTKGRRPWKLVHKEEFRTRSEAMQREMFFKSIEGYRYLKNLGIFDE